MTVPPAFKIASSAPSSLQPTIRKVNMYNSAYQIQHGPCLEESFDKGGLLHNV
jgi:hypothetical protein